MTRVDQHLLLRALIDELVRGGVQTAVTCPGSRNTPIVEALVAAPGLSSLSQLDERGGGFFAVGAARAAERPVAITVTSGTAVANLLPAVIEASEAGLGLIVLSADRPAELRQIGAGQTIDQVQLFGPYVRFFAELDLAEASPERLRWVRSLTARALLAATGEDPGPVHLNLPLREPLVLDAPLPPDPTGGDGRPGGRRWVELHGRADAASGDADTALAPVRPMRAPPVSPRTVIVAGELSRPGDGAVLADLAARHGVPLLADPLSGARRGGAAVAHYDLILRDPVTAASLTPERVLRVGELPTSKPLRAWLAGLEQAQQSVFHARPVWPDPSSQMSDFSLLTDLAALPVSQQPPEWLARWRQVDTAVADAIAANLDADPGLSEPAVAATLGRRLSRAATVYVAASMPIRDVEEFVAVDDDAPRFLANRGANGIDGTVSSAFGAAAVSDGPVVLFIGDVALLHDIGGLLSARRNQLPLTVVLINNDGGGIFNFLAIAEHDEAFSEHVATPHGVNFAHAAALYGLDHVTPSDVGGLTAALDRAIDGETPTLIEIRTDRVANRQRHADIAREAIAALELRSR